MLSSQTQPQELADTPYADAVTLPGLFKALGDPLRLQIVRLLQEDAFSVSELCAVFGLRQSALSHHLKILVATDLLVRHREGTAIYYRRQIPKGTHEALLDTALAAIDAQPLPEDIAAGYAAIERQREKHSLDFFRNNSERFRKQQDLIAPWRVYSNAALELVDRRDDLDSGVVLEVGPGDGSLLPLLADRCERVVALDNAEAMLAAARTTAGHLENVEFRLGDTGTLSDNEGFLVVVANMVLHHTPDPERLMADAAIALAPGGWLVISELAAHDQAWAREYCGDLWLGFDADQLTQWAQAAGLKDRARVFIAQRNGFQIQVQLFEKPHA